MTNNETLLEVKNLKEYFPMDNGLFSKKNKGFVKAVDDISFTVNHGDIFGIVGESGCGKTTVLKLLLNLLNATDGKILFRGHDISSMSRREKKAFHAHVQAVLQDPYGSLSPRMRVKNIIGEPLEIQRKDMSAKQRQERVNELLKLVKLNPEVGNNYPHEFSGGQRQRIAIARALALQPELILLDEPVSALDVSVQAQLMNELVDLSKELGLTYVVVAHNLAVIRFMCNRMMVMYLGQIMEYGDCEEIFERRLHPYTKALFQAALSPDPRQKKTGQTISGDMPSPVDLPSGCRFHTRCPYCTELCCQQEPPTESCGDNHTIKCHYWREIENGELVPKEELY